MFSLDRYFALATHMLGSPNGSRVPEIFALFFDDYLRLRDAFEKAMTADAMIASRYSPGHAARIMPLPPPSSHIFGASDHSNIDFTRLR